MTCPDCEYHKNRAARWRAEAYKQAGHDVIELPWVGLTDEDLRKLADKHLFYQPEGYEVSGVFALARAIEAKLKEKNT